MTLPEGRGRSQERKSWNVGSGGQVYQPEAVAQNASELT